MKHAPALAELIDALRALPGVGPKSAQRMAFHLLQDARPAAASLATALTRALDKVGHCQRCRMLTDAPLCEICANPLRDATQICVVESPADVIAVEQSGGYRGRYFVLMGHLSPLDGIGPEDLKVQELLTRISSEVEEIILALNPNIEGEATTIYLTRLLKPLGVNVTRLARGIPIGGNLEFADEATLTRALEGRVAV